MAAAPPTDAASRALKLLVVAHNYPRYPGDPAGAFVARLARATAAHGHEVRAIAPHAPGLAERSRDEDVELQRVRYAPDALERSAYRGDLHQTGLSRPLVALGAPVMLARMRAAVRRAIAEHRIDVVHAHWWIPGGLVAARTGRALVITCHGSDVRLLHRSAVVRRLGRRVLGAAHAVTAVSRFLADDLERAVPVLRGRVRVTPMPVDVEHFARGAMVAKADPPRVLYAGNLLRSKGVHTLIEAVHRLVARGVRVRLRILGEGPMEAELRELARRLNVDASIEWSGFRPQQEMPGEYGASTVTVLPTHGQAEGLGLTLVESLLAGTAVIGTPAGGIPEVVQHERTGLLARDDDPGALADAIERMLSQADLRRALADAGGRHVRATYSADRCVETFLALYDEVRTT